MFKTVLTSKRASIEDSIKNSDYSYKEKGSYKNDIAVEFLGGIFKSKEVKIKEYVEHYSVLIKNIITHDQNLAKRYDPSDLENRCIHLKNTLSKGQIKSDKTLTGNYMDCETILKGLTAIKELPALMQKILSIPPDRIFHQNSVSDVVMSNLGNIEKAFYVAYDRKEDRVSFEPEYHYAGGSELHENPSVEKLGYTKQTVATILDDVLASIAVHKKLVQMIPELEHYYMKLATAEADLLYNHDGALIISVRNVDKFIYKEINPIWIDMTRFSIVGWSTHAIGTITEIIK